MSSIRVASRSPGSLTFTASASTTAGFMIEQFAGGTLYCLETRTGTPPNETVGSSVRLSFSTRVGSSDTDTFAVSNSADTPISFVIRPGRAYPLPDELFGCTWVLPTTANGTATCRIVLKS